MALLKITAEVALTENSLSNFFLAVTGKPEELKGGGGGG